jgi:hypothetical protein
MATRPERPEPPAPPADAPKEQRPSGRVRFDHRGQAVWEWAVRTGMYDRNASTQRIRALTDTPVKLEIAEVLETKPEPEPAPRSDNPYERVPGKPAARAAAAGGNPYERAAATPVARAAERAKGTLSRKP